MRHKFTVIIPTRERASTLEHTLKTCIAQDYDQLEILVCDNASQDQTRDVVAAANDPRIRYINPGRRLSMMENFEFAFSHVKDGYIYSMGDDDGLARGAIAKVNEIIHSTSTDAVVSDFAHYMWPNVLGPAAGQLIASRRNGFELRDTRRDLNDVLYKRRPFNHLPCIYYGFIRGSVLEQLRQSHGRLFLTNIVDLFSSVALSLSMQRYVFSYEPLAINGTSNRSNGAAFMKISSDSTEKDRWQHENISTSIPPFTTTSSIKMMLAEACYAINQAPSPLKHALDFNLCSLLYQAKLDIHLYAKSNTDQNTIEKICADLGYTNLNPGRYQRTLAMLELYANRIPKFLNSDILDAAALGVKDVDAAAQLLSKLQHMPSVGLIERLKLLAKRFNAMR